LICNDSHFQIAVSQFESFLRDIGQFDNVEKVIAFFLLSPSTAAR
jgi:hypothetical protein